MALHTHSRLKDVTADELLAADVIRLLQSCRVVEEPVPASRTSRYERYPLDRCSVVLELAEPIRLRSQDGEVHTISKVEMRLSHDDRPPVAVQTLLVKDGKTSRLAWSKWSVVSEAGLKEAIGWARSGSSLGFLSRPAVPGGVSGDRRKKLSQLVRKGVDIMSFDSYLGVTMSAGQIEPESMELLAGLEINHLTLEGKVTDKHLKSVPVMGTNGVVSIRGTRKEPAGHYSWWLGIDTGLGLWASDDVESTADRWPS